MNNFGHAAQATATSIDSAGSAMKENEAFQESLEYQTNNLKATFQDLANNVIDKELISSVLKLGDAFLKLANTDIGVLVTKIGLLAGAGWGLSSLIQVSKIIPVIVGQFKNFDAARLAAAARVNLRLDDDDWRRELLRVLDGLLGAERRIPLRDVDAVGFEDGLALVLMNIHFLAPLL